MASELSNPFFKFDADDWLTGKVQALDMEAQGIFVNLLARIWRENGKIKNTSFLHRQLRVPQDTLTAALGTFKESGILQENDGFLSVKFLTRQLEERVEYVEQQRKFGRQAGKSRKGASGKNKNKNKKRVNNKEKYTKEIFSFIEMVKKVYPNFSGPYIVERAILDAIDREFDKGMEIPAIVNTMDVAVRKYAETVSTWDLKQKGFAWAANTFFTDGHYLDDPASWQRGEDYGQNREKGT